MAILAGASLFPAVAAAGAWPTPPGETQAILKYERQDADEGLDEGGSRLPIGDRYDESVSLFVEHGLTERFTLQGKAAYTRGADDFVDYSGRGPIELGLRTRLWQGKRSVVSVYTGVVFAGEGRNAGYAAPGAGDIDYELRLLAGRSFTWRKRPGFGEIQLARLQRQGLPNEDHLDLTIGLEPAPKWLILLQSYSGVTDGREIESQWSKGEASLVRSFGDWRLQAGWRTLLSGREIPVDSGPVLGVWRRF